MALIESILIIVKMFTEYADGKKRPFARAVNEADQLFSAVAFSIFPERCHEDFYTIPHVIPDPHQCQDDDSKERDSKNCLQKYGHCLAPVSWACYV